MYLGLAFLFILIVFMFCCLVIGYLNRLHFKVIIDMGEFKPTILLVFYLFHFLFFRPFSFIPGLILLISSPLLAYELQLFTKRSFSAFLRASNIHCYSQSTFKVLYHWIYSCITTPTIYFQFLSSSIHAVVTHFTLMCIINPRIHGYYLCFNWILL